MNKGSFALLVELVRAGLQNGENPRLQVNSNSMAPLFCQGDFVYLEQIEGVRLQPGDIITVVTHSQLLTHRYWGVQQHEGSLLLRTRGDRVQQFDGLWPETAVLGRVCACGWPGKRPLSLHSGPGHRLNRHLAALALFEQQKLQPQNRPGRKLLALWAQLVVAGVKLGWRSATVT